MGTGPRRVRDLALCGSYFVMIVIVMIVMIIVIIVMIVMVVVVVIVKLWCFLMILRYFRHRY